MNIYKIQDRVFKIGEIDYDENFQLVLSSILNLGLKFSPNLYDNSLDSYFSSLINFDSNIYKLNSDVFNKKVKFQKSSSKNSTINNNIINTNINDRVDDSSSLNYEFIINNLKKFKVPKSTKYNNLPIQEEIIDFRTEVFSALPYLKTGNSSNLNKHQQCVLMRFNHERPFKIVQCDKNIGSALISNSLHDQLALNHLLDKDIYHQLTTDPLDHICNNIQVNIENLINNKHIYGKLGKKLFPKNCKNGTFRFLTKLHKAKFGIRPIINTINHPTSSLCKLVELILKPIISKIEIILKDSQQLLQKCENIKLKHKHVYIYSCDFESLYTNIRKEDAINIITNYVATFLNVNYLTSYGFSQILKMIFENNIFKFKEKFFTQIKGIAMGCICGPSIANIFVYLLEKNWVSIHRPVLYYRFIDDILLASVNPLDIINFKSQFNNLKLNIISDLRVNFLDLLIWHDYITGKFLFSLYVKPTGNAGYLKSTSNHPQWIFNNIPTSIFIRIRRICSLYTDYIYHSRSIVFQLIKQGYNLNKVMATMNSIGNTSRNKLIQYKVKKEINVNQTNIWFNVQFNLNTSDFTNIISNAFNSTLSKQEFCKNINFKTYNSIAPNLSSILIFGHKMSLFSRCRTKTCNNYKCKICDYIYPSSFLKLKNGFKVPLCSNGNCDSVNAVYIIKCSLCDLFYIGQTSQKIKIRISQHLRTIEKFHPFLNRTSEVGYHFNLKHHDPMVHFKFTIFKNNLNEINERLNIESLLIDLIDKFNKPVINALKPQLKNNKMVTFI
jgi:hypothetical protein